MDQARRKNSWIRASLGLTFPLIAGRVVKAATSNRGTNKSEAGKAGSTSPTLRFQACFYSYQNKSHQNYLTCNKGPASAGPLFCIFDDQSAFLFKGHMHEVKSARMSARIAIH